MRKLSKLIITLTLITFLFMGQSSLAAVHLPPKALKTAADLSYQVGTTGNTLVWQYEAEESADIAGTYTVFKDDVALVGHDAADWEDKEELIIDVDGLVVGEYTYKIQITDHDTSDNPAVTANDEAIVTVVAELASSSTTTPVTSSTTTAPAESSTESDSSVLFVPIIAMLFAIGVGVPILKYKNIRN